ncbi:MAG: class I SAM-dependent methyltransferase [Nitrospinae bacterium]|nr:class I SAM-dependent methyltransferase [Nitrospinota bacterium]MBI3814192.1 class I SAM-dependent methyltransferase [Nitrospinota bacterium]
MFINICNILKTIARRVLPDSIQLALLRLFGKDVPVSYGYKIIDDDVSPELLHGWQEQTVAERQWEAFAPLLQQMREGKPREDFIAVAEAVRMTGLDDPFIIEVGCGSGWNSEVLTNLLKYPVHLGLDYSSAMAALGKKCYPNIPFIVGDATALPFQDGDCDILLSGTVLMHLMGYREAIYESRRVARKWCIFHTVPIMRKRPTTKLRKYAYGESVIEVIYNEDELLNLMSQNGLSAQYKLDSIPYDLSDILGEHTLNRTYVCKVVC